PDTAGENQLTVQPGADLARNLAGDGVDAWPLRAREQPREAIEQAVALDEQVGGENQDGDKGDDAADDDGDRRGDATERVARAWHIADGFFERDRMLEQSVSHQLRLAVVDQFG